MAFRIRLDENIHSEFLSEQRIDPITQEPLRSGDEIVFCAAGKIAFLSENWNGKCPRCGGTNTLPGIPNNTIPKTISKPRSIPRSPIAPHPSNTNNHSERLLGIGSISAVVVGIIVVASISFLALIGSNIDFSFITSFNSQETLSLTPSDIKENEDNITSGVKPTPTEIRINPTSTIPVLPENYSCNDIEKVKLFVGAKAVCDELPVNVRSDPQIPDDQSSNIVYFLASGETFTIIGGPRCAHYGTWWQVKVASGVVGWVREYSSYYGRLIRIDN